MRTNLASQKLLDDHLQKFYDSHNVSVSSLLSEPNSASGPTGGMSSQSSPFLYRFVRLNPRHDSKETLQKLTDELEGDEPIPVAWLPEESFYALPADFKLSVSPCFQSGRVYGMDVSSGAAVSVLLSAAYDRGNHATSTGEDSGRESDNKESLRVLDICCCPGLKLCAIADRLCNTATVVGVDVSEHRMALCKKIVQKYHVEEATSGAKPSAEKSSAIKIQLFCQDGTTFGTTNVNFNLVFDSEVAIEEEVNKGSRKRKNKSARGRERKRLKQLVSNDFVSKVQGGETDRAEEQTSRPLVQIPLFDRVLVDAECSTDGSLKHMRERLKCVSSTKHKESNTMLTDQAQLTELVGLQRRLIDSGYRLLKTGGRLVYSTCSLSIDQNEKIVKWLLDKHEDAYLIPVHFPLATSKLVVEGSLDGTVRFYPNIGQEQKLLFGDGFFVAKLGKKCRLGL